MKDLETREAVSELFDRLYPICRSILGKGYRDSLKILQEYIPFEEIVFESGEKVLNWSIPQEWIIRDAKIVDEEGTEVINFKNNNLHVLNYSDSIDAVLELEQLKRNIYTCSNDERAIPYTTSYYKKRWGFCMSKVQLEQMKSGKYHAYIDSEFVNGQLVVGETQIKGETEKKILLTSYLCHPSMANNELSGPLALAMLYQRIAKWKSRKFTYCFVINPETIGSIAYLSRYGDKLKQEVYGGLVLTCLGGKSKLRYKTSRCECAPTDLLVKKLNNRQPDTYRVEIFDPSTGSDERQYCSPGYDFPIGQMARMVYGEYKEYHTSLDTKDVMGVENVIESVDMIERFLMELEKEDIITNCTRDELSAKKEGKLFYLNLKPYGEIKLGDYDLYPTLNVASKRSENSDAIYNEPWFIKSVMMILSYGDGAASLEYCAKRLGLDVPVLQKVAELLVEKGLMKRL